eukprot:scaffold8800_cov107-Cylindrotheca_fusiformis.AAC.5
MGKVQDVTIGVHNFFMMKHIVEDGEGSLSLVGTMIQHAFAGTNNELLLKDIQFGYRFNDETADEDSGFVKHRRTEEHDSTLGTLYRHTYQIRAPLEINVVLDYFPFKVVSAKLLVELSTITTGDNRTRLRPNLLVHKSDKPNMFCIQKEQLLSKEGISILEQAKDKMDRAESYDFISPFPKVSYLYDTNKKYCPKFQVTFLMVEDGMNTVHVLNPEEQDMVDYIANSATFALSVLVFLPSMVGSSRRQNLYTANNMYIMMIFVALFLSSIPESWVDTNVPALCGMGLYWASFLFPFINGFRYLSYVAKAKHTANPRHFWPDANKNVYKAAKSDAEECLVKVQDIVYMDDKARKESEYTLRKTSKFQVLEYAREPAGREHSANGVASS